MINFKNNFIQKATNRIGAPMRYQSPMTSPACPRTIWNFLHAPKVGENTFNASIVVMFQLNFNNYIESNLFKKSKTVFKKIHCVDMDGVRAV